MLIRANQWFWFFEKIATKIPTMNTEEKSKIFQDFHGLCISHLRQMFKSYFYLRANVIILTILYYFFPPITNLLRIGSKNYHFNLWRFYCIRLQVEKKTWIFDWKLKRAYLQTSDWYRIRKEFGWPHVQCKKAISKILCEV